MHEVWLLGTGGVLFAAAAALAPGSTVVEIGSHQGRSTVVLASALSVGSRLVAIDPFDATWRYGAPDTRRLLADHLEVAQVAGRVEVRAETSRVERELIVKALEETGGNVTQAARLLKISRKSLQMKMKELGLRDRET